MISNVLRGTLLRQARHATIYQAGRRMASTASPSTAPLSVWPWAVGAAATSGAAGYWYARQPTAQRQEGVTLAAPKDLARAKVDAQTIKTAFDRLQKVLPPEHVTVDEDALQFHGFTTNSYHNEGAPNIVVYPQNTQQVVDIVNIANDLK
jgi:D-lactate dehydrogenase (cytochrome)